MNINDVPEVARLERAIFSDPWSEKVYEETLMLEDVAYLVVISTCDEMRCKCDETGRRIDPEDPASMGGAELNNTYAQIKDGAEINEKCCKNGSEADSIIGVCGVRNILGDGEITNVMVLPEYRKRNIATRMLEELLEEGKKLGARDFTLEVRSKNAAAIHLYEKLGFKIEGIRKGYYEHPKEDALIMWKRNA